MLTIPIVCETPRCPNEGEIINSVSGIPAALADAFYEDFDGSDPADVCPLCGAAGVAADPIDQPAKGIKTRRGAIVIDLRGADDFRADRVTLPSTL